MIIREACSKDVEMLFEIRTSVSQNYMSREELAAVGITPEMVTEMLQGDYQAEMEWK